MKLSDLICDPHGKLSEAKAFAVLFKAALLYAFLRNTVLILSNWEILTVVVTTFVAPDLLKKLISMRVGLTTTSSSSSTTVVKEDK